MAPPAAAGLARLIAGSTAGRVAFLGLAKNVGKTTALVAALAALDEMPVAAGATSAGRDGEEFDALTGEEKPRFFLRAGQLVASAASTFRPQTSQRLRVLPLATRFGAIEVHRLLQDGAMEVIGPATVSQMAEAARALLECGAAVVLIDGAFGRRAFASARAADAIVLSVGLAAGRDLDAAVEAARLAAELIALPAPPPKEPVRSFEGALTDASFEDASVTRGEILVAEDFASIFLSPARRRALAGSGVRLAVRRPARIVAVTANPTAPGGRSEPPRRLFDALAEALPGLPLFDLEAGLARIP
ncbi:MAG: hypothetical protein ABI592_13135 [Acidobacteriota bacterium]